jgi:hypothetical protein
MIEWEQKRLEKTGKSWINWLKDGVAVVLGKKNE